MQQLQQQTWHEFGHTHTITITVHDGRVVSTKIDSIKGFHKPKMIGDRMGEAIGKVTGRSPCRGCKKVEAGLNGLGRAARSGAATLRHMLTGKETPHGR